MQHPQHFEEFDDDGDRILDVGQLTELEKQEAAKAREMHRLNMTKNQKGFKGERAFISKPAEIAFRDFNLGKPHYQVITLTNVSNAFNSFNVLPLPQNIRNYFQVDFKPKGKISPGISTDIRFKFFPQLNQDIYSEFTILAQTGLISYPIVCTSRKTIVRCDSPIVDFDRIIYGQSMKAKLIIRNQGSLPSQYCFLNPDGSEIGSANTAEELKFINHLTFQKKGEIGGNTEKNIVFEFRPSEIGAFALNLQLAMKNVLHSPPIPISFNATCVEVPVLVQHSLYDLQICLLGHIYRQKLTFYNRSQMPMSFKMSQFAESKKYFEFNPVIGYIQKASSLDVWIKFTADKDIALYLSRFQTSPGEYVIPFQMIVKEQVLPVDFKLKFRVTTDHVIVRPPQLNFGRLYEGLSSRVEVQLQNESELPQEILLYPLGKHLSVQNDQPLIKLLPLQTYKTAIIYHSKQLEQGKSYRQEDSIGCRVITGQLATNRFDIRYICEVFKADLAFTHNKIDLPTLQEGESVQASTRLKNNSNKEILYELFVPDQVLSGLRITPVVATLQPKEEVQLSIQYKSTFKTLSPNLLAQAEQKKKLKTQPVQQQPPEEQKPKKDSKKEAKLTKQQQEALEQEQKRKEEEQRLKKQQEQAHRLQLERNFNLQTELIKLGGKVHDFEGVQHYRWLLPVYFKQKDYSDVSAEVNFLEVTTTTITRVLEIDEGEVDFGEVAVGSRGVRELKITNRGEDAQLHKRSMPAFCSFNVLNSLKAVSKNGSFKAVVEFQPIEEQRFQQKLQFFTDKYTVSCMLKGKGVRPEVLVEPGDGLVNMGGVLLDEYSEKTVKIKNACNFEVAFELQKVGSGILNTNSGSAFTYIPSHGNLPAHGTIEVKIRFKPDRIGQKFFDKIKVHVEEQKSIKYLYVAGSCYPRQAYVTDYRPIAMPSDDIVRRKIQYVFDSLRFKDENSIYGPGKKSMLLEYAKEVEDGKEELRTQRKLVVGSCKLLDNKMEKPTNFEVILPKDDHFTCDNLKGTAAPGAESIITFTYKPEEADPLLTGIPELEGLGQWRQIKAEVKISGGFAKPGITDQFSLEVVLKFYVSQL